MHIFRCNYGNYDSLVSYQAWDLFQTLTANIFSFFPPLQEESKDFITPENLEGKINHALDNETNYNFALKPNGERIYSTKPPGNVKTDQPGPAAFGFTSSYKEELPSEREPTDLKD